jgi:predicted SprT family Zn-dependent metalloprotease
MEPAKWPTCRSCGEPMTFATRVTMPRQSVYRCESCKEQAWIPDRNNEPQKDR